MKKSILFFSILLLTVINAMPQALQTKIAADLRPVSSRVTFSPNGKYMATAGRLVRIYEFNNGNLLLIKTLKDHSNEIKSVSFSPDGKYLATGSCCQVKIYSVPGGSFSLIKTL